jgi:cellobiose-specific phosphotransferase system component IIC
VPGLAVSAGAVLKLFTGTGLGFEKWEAGMQQAAGVIGIIVSVAIAVSFANATREKKKQLIKWSVLALVICTALTFGADVLQSILAKSNMEIYLLRDVLWKIIYFLFCISIILCLGCVSLLIPRVGRNDAGNNPDNNPDDNQA